MCLRHLQGSLIGIRPFSIFGPKKFFAISRFLDEARARRRCQRHLQRTLNGMRPFSFFVQKNFFAISQFLNVARARRRCQRHLQCALNGIQQFSFLDKKFFCDISITGRGTGVTDVSTAPTRYPKRYATIFSVQKERERESRMC